MEIEKLFKDENGEEGVGIIDLINRILLFSKVLRKSKLSEPHTHAQQFYKNGFTTTKNKPYFVRLVGRLVK